MLIDAIAEATTRSCDLASGGLASGVVDGARIYAVGHAPTGAFARYEGAMLRARAAAGNAIGSARDRVDADIAPGTGDKAFVAALGNAGAPRIGTAALRAAHGGTVTSAGIVAAAAEAGRDVGRRTMVEAIAAIRREREVARPIAKFMDEALARQVGRGAPDALARVARRMAALGLASGLAVTMVPSDASAWVMRGGGGGGQPIVASFPRPAQRFQVAPIVINRVVTPVYTQQTPPAFQGGNYGNGYNNGGFNNGGYYGRPAIVPFAAGVALGTVAGAVGSGLNNQTPYYQGNNGYGGYGRGVPAQVYAPSPRIVTAAKLAVAMRMGSIRGADAHVDQVVRQGMACAAHGASACTIDTPAMHFDFRQGVYGVKMRGADVAVETRRDGYREIDHETMRQAFVRAEGLKAREDGMAMRGQAPGAAMRGQDGRDLGYPEQDAGGYAAPGFGR